MARGRMISKSLSTSERRAKLHQEAGDLAEFCQSLYPLIVAHADDFGRLTGSAFHVKHAIDPTSPRPVADFERALRALHAVGMITWYVVSDRQLIEVWNFDPHQMGLHKRKPESDIPGPSEQTAELPGISGKSRKVPGNSPLTELNLTELNRTETNGTELRGEEPAALTVPLTAPVMARPTFSRFRKGSPSILANACHLKCDRATWGACARGMCIPAFVVQAWRLQLGDDAHAQITAFVDATMAAHPEGVPFGDDPLKYWRGKWSERHGTALRGDSKGARIISEAQRAVELIEARQAREAAGLHD